MSTYTIGEIAERSGFSASALRYYEGIGLVPPATRTGAGYRLYDESALPRLAFIARAKQLGCSLEEITDLVAIWEGDKCGPVQRRFSRLVTAKIVDTRRRIAELTEFTGQLEYVASHLAGPAEDGPCSPTCACGTVPATTGPAADPPIVCTLEADAVPQRLSDWQSVLAQAVARTTTADGAVRVNLGSDVDVTALASLVAAEQSCCAFFSFSITVDRAGVALEVRAPDGAANLVDQLFEAAAEPRSTTERR